jgi:hypothetical protein
MSNEKEKNDPNQDEKTAEKNSDTKEENKESSDSNFILRPGETIIDNGKKGRVQVSGKHTITDISIITQINSNQTSLQSINNHIPNTRSPKANRQSTRVSPLRSTENPSKCRWIMLLTGILCVCLGVIGYLIFVLRTEPRGMHLISILAEEGGEWVKDLIENHSFTKFSPHPGSIVLYSLGENGHILSAYYHPDKNHSATTTGKNKTKVRAEALPGQWAISIQEKSDKAEENHAYYDTAGCQGVCGGELPLMCGITSKGESMS